MNNEKFDITEFYPKLYVAKHGSTEIIDVPMLRVLAINGEGSIDSPRFKESIDAIYSVAYAILQMPKDGLQIDDFLDFKISPLEILWSTKNGKDFLARDYENSNWEAFIVVPGFVTQKVINMASARANEHKPNKYYEDLHISSLQEKKCIQTLHDGSYTTIHKDLDKLLKSIKRRGYKPSSRYHEIYLSDPTRRGSGRQKTIIRQPVIKV